MSLSGAIAAGRSALNASQVGLQVTSNNTANASTPGFTRQVAFLEPLRGSSESSTSGVGKGVRIREVRRQIDEALEARLRASTSDEAAASQRSQTMTSIESILGELGEDDLSTNLTSFFGAWSEVANSTGSGSVAVQQGQRLADLFHQFRSDLIGQRTLADRQLGQGVDRADDLLDQVASLNRAIANSETSGGEAGALRDQRDRSLAELSQLMDVTAVPQASGMIDVLVGSTPVVLGDVSRGVELERTSVDGQAVVSVRVRADGQRLDVRSGQVGALLSERSGTIDATIDRVDELAARVIFEVNKIHGTGTPPGGYQRLSGSLGVAVNDRALSINDPANQTFNDLPFQATSGSFLVHVKDPQGRLTSTRIDIDLDGLNSAGVRGFADDTSPETLRAALGAIPGLNASFDGEGKLVVAAEAGHTFSFGDDSSGALAVLGVGGFFSGGGAADIQVRTELSGNPNRLASGRIVNGTLVDNGTTKLIAGLQERSLTALEGRTIGQAWNDVVLDVGSRSAGAQTQAQAASIVRENLEGQRAAVSGVSLDEEAVNLLAYQRQFQGAARVITVANEMLDQLIALV
ncbi:MAG: flagellar hook-associated protein FlgK [Planctomycetota bacterium]|nr:flagellar hook-associated protein FlgK [Planctomycetota bacterium]